MEGTLEEPPIKDSSQASPDKILKGIIFYSCLKLLEQPSYSFNFHFYIYFTFFFIIVK